MDSGESHYQCAAWRGYATGRPMNYGDRKVIGRIVRDVKRQGNGFADLIVVDLIVVVVQSESFRAKYGRWCYKLTIRGDNLAEAATLTAATEAWQPSRPSDEFLDRPAVGQQRNGPSCVGDRPRFCGDSKVAVHCCQNVSRSHGARGWFLAFGR